ncbi:MAG: 50S ribosomal protein L3 [Planctomycetaceae bacterium]|jgi:large subunit ribosomal protein L3|nr:50S ribosomal protein L3 [Planctomycetaceae bacterium]
MGIGLLGHKVGCTQVYTKTGEAIPVTIIQAGPCPVLQVKNALKDGYEAVQIGYLDKKRARALRSEQGHVASKIESKRRKKRSADGVEVIPKADCEPKQFIREFRLPVDGFQVGQELTVNVFDQVVAVDVTAVSKGQGYSGTMRRHNFAGQRASHGVKKCHRHLGSTGCSAFPSRTMKGKKMAGQWGAENITIRNQKLVYVDPTNNLLVIRGVVPGPNGGFVKISPTNTLPAPKTNRWLQKIEKEEPVTAQ